MKIRNGFVSNSSSSSFVIQKRSLSTDQLELIRNHIEEGRKLAEGKTAEELDYACFEDGDAWTLTETDTTISGGTIIDNFDMEWFLQQIGVAEKDIEWGDY